ncbi:MAG: type II secretion system protein GspL [Candidatus Rariloculaceae bacterium]
MSEYLVVRLKEDTSEPTWIILDETGNRVSQAACGPLQNAVADAVGRQVILLVDGLDIVNTTVNVPVKSQTRLKKILPYTVEDLIVNDIESVLICSGERNTEGEIPVAIVARKKLDDWLSRCEEVNLPVNLIYADTEGVPGIPGNLTLMIENERIYCRPPNRPPFVLDGINLNEVFDIISFQKPNEGELRHIVIYSDENSYAHREPEIDSLRDRFSSIEIQLLPEGPLSKFGANLVNSPGTNLLQGSYRTNSYWSELFKPWRFAALLLLGFGTIATSTEAIRYYLLSQEDAALNSSLEIGCQSIFQTSTPAACRSEIQQLLSVTGASTEGLPVPIFLSTLSVLAEVHNSANQIEAISFRNNMTDLRFISPDIATLDNFAIKMANDGKFQVNILSANPGENGVEGRIQILDIAR